MKILQNSQNAFHAMNPLSIVIATAHIVEKGKSVIVN